MNHRRQWIPVSGLIATIAIAAAFVVQLHAQRAPAGDYSKAALAEVKNAQGAVILSGKFVPVDEDDEDIERKATLTPAGPDKDATGTAEVEVSKEKPAEQEIEFAIRNVDPAGRYTFLVDGKEIGSAVADKNGRAGVDLNVATTTAPVR